MEKFKHVNPPFSRILNKEFVLQKKTCEISPNSAQINSEKDKNSLFGIETLSNKFDFDSSISQLTSGSDNISPELLFDESDVIIETEQFESFLPEPKLTSDLVEEWLTNLNKPQTMNDKQQSQNFVSIQPLNLLAVPKDISTVEQPSNGLLVDLVSTPQTATVNTFSQPHIFQIGNQLYTTSNTPGLVASENTFNNTQQAQTIIFVQELTCLPLNAENMTGQQTTLIPQIQPVILNLGNTPTQSVQSSPPPNFVVKLAPSNNSSPESNLAGKLRKYDSIVSLNTNASSMKSFLANQVTDLDYEDEEFLNILNNDDGWKELNVIEQLSKLSTQNKKAQKNSERYNYSNEITQKAQEISSDDENDTYLVEGRRKQCLKSFHEGPVTRRAQKRQWKNSCTSDSESEPPKHKMSTRVRECSRISDLKSTEYLTERDRRSKNNEASRKSRAAKKQRICQMSSELEQLEDENHKIYKILEFLTSVVNDARERLVEEFEKKDVSDTQTSISAKK